MITTAPSVMAYPGARVVILCCFFVHFAFNADLVIVQGATPLLTSLIHLAQGITLLFYPVLGLVADLKCNRYNFIKVSIILLFVSSLLGVLYIFSVIVIFEVQISLLDHIIASYIWPMAAVLISFEIISLGMFDAVGIQFGMDQMIEASSDQISAFTHWYYWSMNIGIGVQALLVMCCLYILSSCTLHVKSIHDSHQWEAYVLLYGFCPVILLQAVVVSAALFSFFKYKSHLTIEPAGNNSFTMVYKVLKYSWQHKCPERRSAFTYWEEDVPPRIDLGKSKYGGPFTTEEVEDVKTFLLLLLILVSLFGFHLAGNGYSLVQHLNCKLCPSVIVHDVVSVSPNILQTVTVLVSVPILHFAILPRFHRYIPNMLHRLGIGVVLVFFQELAEMVIVLAYWEGYSTCPEITSRHSLLNFAPIGDCYGSHMYIVVGKNCTNEALHDYCGHGDELFLWSLVPIATHAIAYNLVFMTALEFISAQAPLEMKGLLVTFWYALSSQRYLVQAVIMLYVDRDKVLLLFYGVKASLILLSIVFYCCVAKRYRYRLRDEVVNERYLVEEVYDRELRLAEEYEKECKETQSVSVVSDSGMTSRQYGSTDTPS